MQVPIEDIVVKKRVRQDMGNIEALAESFKKYGQISPILISKRNVLIAGGRRLEAARSLGWRTINAVIADIPEGLSPLEYEVEENMQRRDFSPEESADASRRLFRLRNPGPLCRFFRWLTRVFKRVFKIED
ncbi:MAG: ParB N-terminal domain-containing protein [Treponema sp.]|jgi:ParB family chromosome partitioning protein|nr:ParB N-terminal domain-containing protein [Treponema sp.]